MEKEIKGIFLSKKVKLTKTIENDWKNERQRNRREKKTYGKSGRRKEEILQQLQKGRIKTIRRRRKSLSLRTLECYIVYQPSKAEH